MRPSTNSTLIHNPPEHASQIPSYVRLRQRLTTTFTLRDTNGRPEQWLCYTSKIGSQAQLGLPVEVSEGTSHETERGPFYRGSRNKDMMRGATLIRSGLFEYLRHHPISTVPTLCSCFVKLYVSYNHSRNHGEMAAICSR